MAKQQGRTQTTLDSRQRRLLHALGLSKDAVELYGLLLKHGRLTAHASSVLRSTHPSAEYRLFYALEALGLARHADMRPRVFEPVQPAVGLRAAYADVTSRLSGLLAGGGEARSELELVVGRQALYERYIEFAATARHEVWVYAIGIAYSPELEITQRELIRRGVSFHHLVQEVRPANYHVVRRWLRLGMHVRCLPAERGFHLMIFDETRAVVTFSDPQNTEDRLSIVTGNRQAVRLFRAQFRMLWQAGQDVDSLALSVKIR